MKENPPFYLPPGFFVDEGVRYGDDGVWVCPDPLQILNIAKFSICKDGELVTRKLIIFCFPDAPTEAYAWLASEALKEETWQAAHERCPRVYPQPTLLCWYLRGLVVEFVRRQGAEK